MPEDRAFFRPGDTVIWHKGVGRLQYWQPASSSSYRGPVHFGNDEAEVIAKIVEIVHAERKSIVRVLWNGGIHHTRFKYLRRAEPEEEPEP